MPAVRHYHHHYHFSYLTSTKRHFTSIALVIFALIPLLIYTFQFVSPIQANSHPGSISLGEIVLASFYSISRLTVAYLLSLVLAIPLSLLITLNSKVERVLLPIFDIIQSIPILAFFPIVVLVFLKVNFFNGAAIFVIFMQMVWIIAFSMIGGLKTIPEDIKNACLVFRATGWKKLTQITLPSVFPYIITGSLLAWSAGWNILVVAEVIHAYLPAGLDSQDLFGLGSLLVNSSAQGQNITFIVSLSTMIVLIGSLNFFVWQKLLHLAERYKYD